MFREAVLVMAVFFIIFYVLYLTKQWLLMIEIVICIVAGILVYRAFQEDWDKKWGIDGQKENKI